MTVTHVITSLGCFWNDTFKKPSRKHFLAQSSYTTNKIFWFSKEHVPFVLTISCLLLIFQHDITPGKNVSFLPHFPFAVSLK